MNERLQKIVEQIAKYEDQNSFKNLFEIYYPRLFEFARYYVKSSYNAEEVVSDAFVKIWKHRENLLRVRNINAYLYTLVKRESLNFVRKHKFGQHLTIDIVDAEIRHASVNPHDELLTKELLNKLNDSIQELPEKCRMVYQMVKEDGLKYHEAAEILDISVKAVEMHIGKALKRIRAEITDYYAGKDIRESLHKILMKCVVLLSACQLLY